MKLNRVADRVPVSAIEMLESRIAPAGVVSTIYLDDILILNGDAANNELKIEQVGPDTFSITGLNGTLLNLNGGTPSSVILEGKLKDVRVTMGAGVDRLELNGLSMGKLSFDGGSGNDTLSLIGVEVSGAVTYQGGDTGNDIFNVSGARSFFGGAVTAEMGDGVNIFQLGGSVVEIGGLLTVSALGGADQVIVSLGHLLLKKGVIANLGDGNNEFDLLADAVRSLGSIAITHGTHAGAAKTSSLVGGTFTIKGDLTIDYGTGPSDTDLGAFDFSVSGAVRTTAGDGDDEFSLTGFGGLRVKGGIDVTLGKGANSFLLTSQQTIETAVEYTGGDGADIVSISAGVARLGRIVMDLGDGANNLTVNAGELLVTGAASFTTGAGFDHIGLQSQAARYQKGLTIIAGDGLNDVSIGGRTTVTGAMAVHLGNNGDVNRSSLEFFGSEIKVSGALAVVAGLGGHKVEIGASVLTTKSFLSELGGGVDSLSVDAVESSLGQVMVRGGTGSADVRLKGGSMTMTSFTAAMDRADNDVRLELNRLAIKGKFDYVGSELLDGVQILATSVQVKGITVELGDGNGGVSVSGGDLQLGSLFSVHSGDAAANVNVVVTARDSLVSGAMKVQTSATSVSNFTVDGRNAVKIASINFENSVGPTNYTYTADGVSAVGATTLRSNQGIFQGNVTARAGKLGALTLNGSPLEDSLTIELGRAEVAAIKTLMGAGVANLFVTSTGSARVKGGVDFQAQNEAAQAVNVNLTGLTVGGPLTVRTGAGADFISVENCVVANTVLIETAGGVDAVSLNAAGDGVAARFAKAVTVLLGEGDDTLQIGSSPTGGATIFKAKVMLDGQAGTDTTVGVATNNNTYPAGSPVLTSFETTL